MRFSFWSLFNLSCIVLLSACGFSPAATTGPAPATPAAGSGQEPSSPTVPPSPGPTRYFNEEGQFSLQLPEGWQALGPLPVDNDPDRPFNLYVLGPDPAPGGGPGSSLIAIADPQLWTAEQFALAQCSTCPANSFEEITMGGKTAQRTQVGGGGAPFLINWYFVENNGKLIALAIHDPDSLEPLIDVLQSIQFE